MTSATISEGSCIGCLNLHKFEDCFSPSNQNITSDHCRAEIQVERWVIVFENIINNSEYKTTYVLQKHVIERSVVFLKPEV